MATRIFVDTEFIEDGRHIELLSIGAVDEQGHELYLISNEFDPCKANPFVRDQVLPHLGTETRWSREMIRERFKAFAGTSPEFWGYYADYDWVVLCQLFGAMVNLPTGWPYYCRDLRQALDDRGHAAIKQPDDALHHALSDAKWIAATWKRYVEPT